MDFSALRKSRLSAPQLQAQLSRLTDRTRLRRLKDALLSKSAWQQVARIEDLCQDQVSHKWLYHLDACAGSGLSPRDCSTNVQKRLGNRLWVGGDQCRCCGSFLDPQLEHAETCSTAEATRAHYACVHAVVCGRHWQTQALPRNPGDSQLRAPDACEASSIAAAVRGDAAQAAFDRNLTHYRNELGELRMQNIHYRPLVRGPAAASGRHSNASVRGKHRLQSKRAAFVGEIPLSQVETQSKGSHGSRSSPESFSEGGAALRWHHRQSLAPLGTRHRS